MGMKRKILMVVFAVGTVAGYGSAFSHGNCWRERHEARREAFERRVAKVCVDAAREAGRHGHGHLEHGEHRPHGRGPHGRADLPGRPGL